MAEDKKRLSVAEMLAAARKADADRKSGGGESAASEPAEENALAAPEPAAAPEAAAVEAAEAAPAAKPVAKPKPAAPKAGGGRMSVAEMMAAARAGDAGGAVAEKPVAAKPVAAKTAAAKPAAPKPASAKAAPAAKPAAEKPAAKAAPKAPAEPDRSASILAAARGEKPGPMTKAQAATKPAPARESIAAAKAKLAVPPMPQKPAYAVPKPKATTVEERRGVMQLLLGSALAVGFTAMAVTGGVWSLLTARFMFPNILNEPPSRFPVGPPDAISPGEVSVKYVSQHVWVVNYEYKGKKEIFALRTVCTHLGCTPNWLESEQKFKCPCHGSGYYKDGVNFEGPAPRPLERFAIQIGDDGQLQVDTSKTFHEELGQWTDPASFVTV